jgi:co-chaperonin GroES (HSP10)
MAKKLFVPDRVAANVKAGKAEASEIPHGVTTAFKQHEEETKNNEDPSKLEASALERLPQPVGYRLLVIPYYMKAQTKGGVYIPDSTRDRESFATVAAYVVKMGPDAYKDADKFPSGPWCSEKSWVLMGRYAGNRFKVDGLEVRLINDDNIIATILDPADISYV